MKSEDLHAPVELNISYSCLIYQKDKLGICYYFCLKHQKNYTNDKENQRLSTTDNNNCTQ